MLAGFMNGWENKEEIKFVVELVARGHWKHGALT